LAYLQDYDLDYDDDDDEEGGEDADAENMYYKAKGSFLSSISLSPLIPLSGSLLLRVVYRTHRRRTRRSSHRIQGDRRWRRI